MDHRRGPKLTENGDQRSRWLRRFAGRFPRFGGSLQGAFSVQCMRFFMALLVVPQQLSASGLATQPSCAIACLSWFRDRHGNWFVAYDGRASMPDTEQRSISSLWFSSPLILAIVGLIGTGFGAVLQGFWNTRLEREKFEFSLIEKALATPDKKDAALNLKFLVDAGLINQFNSAKIASVASDPKTLPNFSPSPNVLSVHDAKAVLSHLGIYQGSPDDLIDDAFRKAVADFQRSHSIVPDGIVGALTSTYMRDAWREHFVPQVVEQPRNPSQ